MIIITGATSGIGSSLPGWPLKKGPILLLAGREKEDLITLADELSSDESKVIYMKVDALKKRSQ
ncbi:MAG: SDR family NAD(P)-dependent oxidoreductase [Alkalibacterium sp.]|nr:SDR family NAD(P)-dependent oxidoreductase [Alkalibacterium sp.]